MEFAPGIAVILRDVLDVSQLVAFLRRTDRKYPVVVLTIAPGEHSPYVEPGTLTGKRRASVVTLPNDALTRKFSELLEDPTAGAYRGACRVYPPGSSWEEDTSTAPPRLARDAAEIKALPGLLAQDLERALRATVHQAADPASARTEAGRPAPVLRTISDAAALGAWLHSHGRPLPAVVVSRASHAGAPFADVTAIREALSGIADVFEIANLQASWAFSEAVPPRCQVYGGAGRAYPVGTDWEADPLLSPLRFAYGTFDTTRITRELIADAMQMASRTGGRFGDRTPRRAPVEGTVKGIVGERALVGIPGHEDAVCWPELLEPGLSAERLFEKGMQIRGEFDPETKRIDVRGMRRDAIGALADYRPGVTILARVESVQPDKCSLELFPGVTRVVPGGDITADGTDPRLLFRPGDIVPVWFGGQDDDGDEWLLSLVDADEPDAAVPAPSVLEGGPPWLVPQPVDDHADAPLPDAPPDEPHEVAGEVDRREFDALVGRLLEVERQRDAASSESRRLRQELGKQRRRKARSRPSVPDDRFFLDEEDQLDFEVRNAWARSVHPAEKAVYPLLDWRYGPDFFTSLAGVQGVSRSRVVEVLVHVLTGRDAEIKALELHQLRNGMGGDDPVLVREMDQAKCWRVSLQVNSPSARRLHYWKCPDGSIELASVRLHDDFRP